MSKASKEKGKRGEREFANLLRDHLGVEVSRNLDQVRNGGHDIDGLPFAIEVKRREKLALNEWWLQTVKQAHESRLIPALAYRVSYQREWRVVLPAYVMDKTYRQYAWCHDIDYTINVGERMFIHLCREMIDA